MQQVFVTLQYLLKDKRAETLIKHFDERRIFQYDEYFLLEQTRIKRLFQTNLQHLQSDITLTSDFFDLETTKVAAMTIDGDFILANDQRTYIVPKNMVVADLEVFEMPLIDFFVHYEELTLNSNILPAPAPLKESPSDQEIVEKERPKFEEAEEKKGFFSRFFNN